MSRRAWPLGRSERPSSIAALVQADPVTTRTWLRYSAMSWLDAHDDGERMIAFAPLVFAPEEPARQFVSWVASLDVEQRLRVQQALADVIDSWSPRLDANAATLLILLAGFVGCAGEAAPVMNLLAKSVHGSEKQRRDLAEAAAFFGQSRATPEEARELAYRLRDADLGAPTAAIVLVARAASSYGVRIIEDLRILAPDVIENDPTADQQQVANLRRFTANTLVDALGVSQAYRLALQAQQAGAPELCDALRRWRLAAKRIGETEMRVRDLHLWTETVVDVAGLDERVVSTSASEELLDKLMAQTSIDERRAS